MAKPSGGLPVVCVTLSTHPVGGVTEIGDVARKSWPGIHAYQNVPMARARGGVRERNVVLEVGALGSRADDRARDDVIGHEPAFFEGFEPLA